MSGRDYEWRWELTWYGWRRVLWVALHADFQFWFFGGVLFGVGLSYGRRLNTSVVQALLTTQRPPPPPGIMPRDVWDELNPNPTPEQLATRRHWVRQAVNRYRAADLVPDPKWLAEIGEEKDW